MRHRIKSILLISFGILLCSIILTANNFLSLRSNLISTLSLIEKYVYLVELKYAREEKEREFKEVIGIPPNDCIKNIQADHIVAFQDSSELVFFEYTDDKLLRNLLKEAGLKENQEPQFCMGFDHCHKCPLSWKAKNCKVGTLFEIANRRGNSIHGELLLWIDSANKSCAAQKYN